MVILDPKSVGVCNSCIINSPCTDLQLAVDPSSQTDRCAPPPKPQSAPLTSYWSII